MNIDMKSRAKSYFVLADQYLETASLLLNVLINNGNSNCGIGLSEVEAEENMKNNVLNSDLTLFIPTIFNCYQSTELFIKGLLLLNSIEIKETHEVSDLIIQIKQLYGDKSLIYKEINKFYKFQVEIIKKFKKTNSITTTQELYEALRYPENNKNNKKYQYFDLMYNGNLGIKSFKTILKKIYAIKVAILEEYNKKY